MVGQETILSERLRFYLELLDCTEVFILSIFGHFPLCCKNIPCLGPDLETHCQKKKLEGEVRWKIFDIRWKRWAKLNYIRQYQLCGGNRWFHCYTWIRLLQWHSYVKRISIPTYRVTYSYYNFCYLYVYLSRYTSFDFSNVSTYVISCTSYSCIPYSYVCYYLLSRYEDMTFIRYILCVCSPKQGYRAEHAVVRLV
jgi:hypothetical protein